MDKFQVFMDEVLVNLTKTVGERCIEVDVPQKRVSIYGNFSGRRTGLLYNYFPKSDKLQIVKENKWVENGLEVLSESYDVSFDEVEDGAPNYIIVSAKLLSMLETKVNEKIIDGYEVCGSLVMNDAGNFQTMIKGNA